MIIKIKKSDCEHLKDTSFYNNNYYKLPFEVDGCNMLFEHFDGGETFCGNSIGYWIEKHGQFIDRFYLNAEFDDEYFVFDSESFSVENRWT